MTTQEFYDALEQDAPSLKADHLDGEEQATRVIELYEMHRKVPADPGALGLCMAAYDEWRKGNVR